MNHQNAAKNLVIMYFLAEFHKSIGLHRDRYSFEAAG